MFSHSAQPRFAILAICLMLTFLQGCRSLRTSESAEANPVNQGKIEFAQIAGVITKPLSLVDKPASPVEPPNARFERMHQALLALKPETKECREWIAKLISAYHTLAVQNAKVEAIDQYQPGSPDWSLAIGGVLSTNEDSSALSKATGYLTPLRLIQMNLEASDDIKQSLVEAEKGLLAIFNSESELLRFAKQYAGPSAGATGLGVDYDLNWFAAGNDNLILKNQFGTILTNVTVEAILYNTTGNSIRNVYFVPSWPLGQSLKAICHNGDKWTPSERFKDTESLDVSIYADELQAIRKYQYGGEEHNRDLDRYSSNFSFSNVEYLDFEKGLIWDDPRGVALTPTTALGKHNITITLKSSYQTMGLYWSADSWPANERKIFRSAQYSFRPTSISIQISYPGSTWTKELGIWTVRSE